MEGTFITAPIIFKQLYSIHAPVEDSNSKILPLFYALMTNTSQETYIQLYDKLNEIAYREGINLKPHLVITNFEMATIKAVESVFNVQSKGCFFHLGQSIYKKIQNLKLASVYDDADFSIELRQILALAFLRPLEISQAFDDLKTQIPNEATDLMKWFEEKYVHGIVPKNGSVTRRPPLYPPTMWSVFENEELGFPRIQNKVKAWHEKWVKIVGSKHVNIWSLLIEIQNEQNTVEGKIERILRGESSQKRKTDDDREERLQELIKDKANRKVPDFLKDIANNIAF